MRRSEVHRMVLKEMRNIFYPRESEYLDWMGYKITDENKPSYHHIEKVSDLKGKNESSIATLENGAYLGKKSHELLHKIEIIDKELYESWNYLFRVINNMRVYPIEDIWKISDTLKSKTEKILKR